GLGLQGGGDGAERTLVGLHRLSVRPGPGSFGEGRTLRRAAGGQGGIDQRDLHAPRRRSLGKPRSHRVFGTLRYPPGSKQKRRSARRAAGRRYGRHGPAGSPRPPAKVAGSTSAASATAASRASASPGAAKSEWPGSGPAGSISADSTRRESVSGSSHTKRPPLA